MRLSIRDIKMQRKKYMILPIQKHKPNTDKKRKIELQNKKRLKKIGKCKSKNKRMLKKRKR